MGSGQPRSRQAPALAAPAKSKRSAPTAQPDKKRAKPDTRARAPQPEVKQPDTTSQQADNSKSTPAADQAKPSADVPAKNKDGNDATTTTTTTTTKPTATTTTAAPAETVVAEGKPNTNSEGGGRAELDPKEVNHHAPGVVAFFVNGKPQGVAFSGIQLMKKYYPMFSLYNGAEVGAGRAWQFPVLVNGCCASLGFGL